MTPNAMLFSFFYSIPLYQDLFRNSSTLNSLFEKTLMRDLQRISVSIEDNYLLGMFDADFVTIVIKSPKTSDSPNL